MITSNGLRHPTATMPAASADRLQVPGQAPHPRRPPAHASVSLRHALASARANKGSPSTSSGEQAERSGSKDDGSPSSLQPLMGRDSSGESSNAEQWFDKSNNDVREGGGSFRDNEPPFFMRNSSSLETPPEGHQIQSQGVSGSLPLRTELLQLGTPGSGTDDFRSVIDDLTVQNKKLKRRLKKYEKLHDAHLKDDKLFEVRIHGLPSEKKRELEDMLRKFASSLGTTSDNAFPTDGYSTLLPMLNKEVLQTSHQPSDSAYASMSLSGPGSSAVSGSDKKAKGTPREHLSARQKNIHSYLHDIPLGLMPQQAPANMSERAKKKLVVRKVEQLFVGKGAVGGHQHPLQQQEVSQSAAQADRSARAQAGQSAEAYGAREARMLGRRKANKDKDSSSEATDARVQNSQNDTEQRPTQPIDLDPERAQVPQDNIRYMRSMGFSPPHPDDAPEEGHGWIYINFLFNMAQLHTLHVTSDFAREAMTEVSKKLEVSPDGRKVRWRGGKSVTHSSGSGDITPNTGNSSNDLDGQSPRKRLKVAHGNNSSRSNGQALGGASVRDSHRHAYTPMFHHKSSMDGSDDSSSSEEEEDMNESSQRWDAIGNSSGVTSSGVQASTMLNVVGQKRKKANRDDGPIIYYNNARFCTDLSGERRSAMPHKPPLYSTSAAYPIGDQGNVNSDSKGRGPLADAAILPEAMSLDDDPTDSSQQLSFPSRSPPKSSSDESEEEPIELEVTGIGGVWPDDNFMLNVETRHAHVNLAGEAGSSVPAVSKTLPPHFASILAGSKARNTPRAEIRHEVTDVEVKRLQPSELPPALGFMDHEDDTSYEDSDEEDDDNMSANLHLPDALPPEVSTQPVDFGYRYSSSDYNASDADEEDGDDEDDDSNGEVDLLADIRETNPEFVRAQEREYDATIAERLAEEIPAGSSAATAGGGSGFASPASGVAREDVRQAREALRAKSAPRLRREGSSDSMKVEGLEGSEQGDGNGSDNDEMSDVRS